MQQGQQVLQPQQPPLQQLQQPGGTTVQKTESAPPASALTQQLTGPSLQQELAQAGAAGAGGQRAPLHATAERAVGQSHVDRAGLLAQIRSGADQSEALAAINRVHRAGEYCSLLLLLLLRVFPCYAVVLLCVLLWLLLTCPLSRLSSSSPSLFRALPRCAGPRAAVAA